MRQAKIFIVTANGKKNGLSIDKIIREVNQIVCATEYDINGQSTLYASSYFKGSCLLGVSISADNGSELDSFVKWRVDNGFLKEVVNEDE